MDVKGEIVTPICLVELCTFRYDEFLVKLFDSLELSFNLARGKELFDGSTNNKLHQLKSNHCICWVGGQPRSHGVDSDEKPIGITIL